MEFFAIRSPLAVSTVVRRRTLTANTSQLFLSGFGETTNTVTTYGVPSRLYFEFYNMPFSKTSLKLRTPSKRHEQTPHEETRASLPETGRCVDDLNTRQNQTPDFASILFV